MTGTNTTNTVTEDLSDDDLERYRFLEMTIFKLFDKTNTTPNDALNVLLHAACHISVIHGGIDKETLLVGLAQTYDNALMNLKEESEVH